MKELKKIASKKISVIMLVVITAIFIVMKGLYIDIGTSIRLLFLALFYLNLFNIIRPVNI